MKKSAKETILTGNNGFTLVELLVVIAIIAVLAAVLVLVINPLELMARGRDSSRMSDLSNLRTAIDASLLDSLSGSATTFCFGLTPPCSGASTDAGVNTRKNNGTGWVKVNFSASTSTKVSVLPVDPKNDATYFYKYNSDGASYELNAVLESNKLKNNMTTDGGDNSNVYEIGTSLVLIH